MDDLISRQAAIDAADKIIERDTSGNNDVVNAMIAWSEYIKQLPPAEPKSGQWIIDRSGAYCCSECMEPCAGYVMMKPRDKFCKMCGAKMEVTE